MVTLYERDALEVADVLDLTAEIIEVAGDYDYANAEMAKLIDWAGGNRRDLNRDAIRRIKAIAAEMRKQGRRVRGAFPTPSSKCLPTAANSAVLREV
jgi:hypothetical protein